MDLGLDVVDSVESCSAADFDIDVCVAIELDERRAEDNDFAIVASFGKPGDTLAEACCCLIREDCIDKPDCNALLVRDVCVDELGCALLLV
jgi:hypothetical protein